MAYKGALTKEEAERLGVPKRSIVIYSPSSKALAKLQQSRKQAQPIPKDPSTKDKTKAGHSNSPSFQGSSSRTK